MINLKQKLKTGAALGTVVGLNSADVVEVLSLTGLDWLMIDMEHSTISPADMKSFCRAANGRCAVVARGPNHDVSWIKQVLDAGADGIIAPQVNSAAEAKQIVKHGKYRPLGERGVGIGRAHGFGTGFTEYLETANDRILVAVQIEHIDGVNAIESILAVRGLDAVFIGPYDLSDSLGVRGDIAHPLVAKAIAKVKKACDAKKIPVGIFAGDAATASAKIAEGYRLMALGTDMTHLKNGMQNILTPLTESKHERRKARK